ncbi:NUDIX domain-containing protein [Lysinibacillus odysseyi]|uniref:Nucleoside triphosphatase n=1 Tax=Lysinibacillus odysseyi 34hs-1 = NBRC 100172 TaxID=1220589 RepID=A0A0A3IWE6_9BACI|nr:NUDIX domain-containing protein [Lysinibacillus odysseyi]KGR87750.1 nucleoside triphosphatase [Lysinibacillus odysseyi 34hs-1 = NBRC 100172]
MFTFIDENGLQVVLRFDEGPFEVEPRHVLALVKYEDKWLCTEHYTRGIEFPGGKQEEGETLMEAAIREVYEETQVKVKDARWFAYYVVYDEIPFCKAVFTASVDQIEEFVGEYETLARYWLTEEELLSHPNLSFYMRDDGMKKMLQEVKTHERRW